MDMTTQINKRVEEYLVGFKNDLRDKITGLNVLKTAGKAGGDEDPHEHVRELLEYVFEYPKLVFNPEEITKKKPTVAAAQCAANRSDGSQCTRRSKKGSDCCGTHCKPADIQTTPPVLSLSEKPMTYKLEVSAYDIHGIIFYIDQHANVYCTEDILQGKDDPRIVARAERVGDIYTIPSLGV